MRNPGGLLVVGTTSDAGKTLVAAGLCRVFRRQGFSVQPFKAANMSLNSIPADDGGEIAVAQWIQSVAAGVPPVTLANPILLKSEGPGQVEIIVRGRSTFRVRSWRREMPSLMPALRKAVLQAVQEVRAGGRVVIAEGAGSPVEMNLRDSDLSNFFTAEALDLPVILVADLERGGAIAQIVGTLELLTAAERRRVRGIILNRMRGDRRLLDGACSFIEEKTGVPVLGVLPWIEQKGFRWPEEDSLSLHHLGRGPKVSYDGPRIGVLRYPHVSNFLDFTALDTRGASPFTWIEEAESIPGLDALILPGSRRTAEDLAWMVDKGIDTAIQDGVKLGLKVGGICGGYHILGRALVDPGGFEGPPGKSMGLGLLPVTTTFVDPKIVRNVSVVALPDNPLLLDSRSRPGYEIRRGRSVLSGKMSPMFKVRSPVDTKAPWLHDGVVLEGGNLWGTAVHGWLSSPQAIGSLLRWAKQGHRNRRGGRGTAGVSSHRMTPPVSTLEHSIDTVADVLEESVGIPALVSMVTRAASGSRN